MALPEGLRRGPKASSPDKTPGSRANYHASGPGDLLDRSPAETARDFGVPVDNLIVRVDGARAAMRADPRQAGLESERRLNWRALQYAGAVTLSRPIRSRCKLSRNAASFHRKEPE